jgi:hypothetical protein
LLLRAVLLAAGLRAALPCPAQESYSDPPRSGPYEFPLDEISKGMLLMTPRDRYRIGNRMRRSIENEATLRQTQIFWWKRQIHAESQFGLEEANRARMALEATRRTSTPAAPAPMAPVAQTTSLTLAPDPDSAAMPGTAGVTGLDWPAALAHPWFAGQRNLIEAKFIATAGHNDRRLETAEVRRAADELALALRELVLSDRLDRDEYVAAKRFLDGLVQASSSTSPAPVLAAD